MSKIAETIAFLQGDIDNRFIVITNQETGNVIGKPNVYLSDIPKQDLEHYLKFILGNITAPTLVWIEYRTKKGVSSSKSGVCKVMLHPTGMAQPAPDNLPQVYNPAPIQAVPMPEQNNNHFGQNFGLGVADVIDMKLNKEKLEHKNELLKELKDDHSKLKQDFNLQEIENRQLKSDLSVAKSREDIAVMMVKLENKSFFDSPAFEKIMENAPAMLGSIAQMKVGAVSAGALGSPVTSEAKKEFFEYANDNLSDEQINYLGSICHFMQNQNFVNQLKILIQQTNGTN